jgi:NADP-dependent 3-hydroxy acid dehydrogenase YdfG
MTEMLDAATDLTFVPVRRPLRTATAPTRGISDREREVVVRLGRRWQQGDAGILLSAVSLALRRDAGITLEHAGAGGVSLLRAAAAEYPNLRVDEVVRRHTAAPLKVRPVRWQRHPLSGPGPVPGNGAVAITGGLGGIGLSLAAGLAGAGHPLWLIDRRPVSNLPVAAQHLLGALAARGPVVVSRADTGARPPAAPFPIEHLVCAAGDLELCPVRELTADGLEDAATAKSRGLAGWVPALAPGGLRSVVAFGSVESRRPHRGFAAYALANELLRREAGRLRREHPSIRIVVAEWSLWSQVGMAAASADRAAGAGFAVVPPAWGVAATRALLAPGPDGPDDVVLGGPQSSAAQPLRVVAGVAGSAHSRTPDQVDRLLRLCRPAGANPPQHPSDPFEAGHRPGLGAGTGPVVRAVVRGRRVGCWLSPTDRWEALDRTP